MTTDAFTTAARAEAEDQIGMNTDDHDTFVAGAEWARDHLAAEIRKAQADALREAALEDSANLITIAGWEVEAVEAVDLRARADALEAR